MEDFQKQGGIAFLLLYFSHLDRFYYLSLDDFLLFWNRMQNGGRKSFRLDELSDDWILPDRSGVLVPYLDGIARHLSRE